MASLINDAYKTISRPSLVEFVQLRRSPPALTEVRLRFVRSMQQRQEHLLRPPLRAHIVFHDRAAAGERVLGPHPLKDPLRPVPLPSWAFCLLPELP